MKTNLKLFYSLVVLVVASATVATIVFLIVSMIQTSTKTSAPEEATTQSPSTMHTTSSATPVSPTIHEIVSTTLKVVTEHPATYRLPDSCTVNNGGCSDMCASSGPGSSTVCSCPIGNMLLEDMKTCQVCPEGRFGTSCQLTCECDNNATCNPVYGTCYCPPRFIGQRCSTFVECSIGHCLNGGTCTVELNSRHCTCTVFWEGDRCESPRPIGFECAVGNDVRAANDCFNIGALTGSSGSDRHTTTIAVSVLVPLVVVAVFIIIVVLLRRCTQQNEGREQEAESMIIEYSACRNDAVDADRLEPTTLDSSVDDTGISPCNSLLNNPKDGCPWKGAMVGNLLCSMNSTSSISACEELQATTPLSPKLDNRSENYETGILVEDHLDSRDGTVTINRTDASACETTACSVTISAAV